MIYQSIGKRLQKAREEAHLSQEELASLLGITQSALSNYELGKRGLYLGNLEQIASVLGKPISYFLEAETAEVRADAGKEDGEDKTSAEIMRLLSDLPELERREILEYIRWRRDRLR